MIPFQPPLPDEISQQLRLLEDQMRQQIYTGGKTPLQNFGAFESIWPQIVTALPAHLLFVEMDEMKRLNNEFGHEDADRFLEELGKILHGLGSPQIYAFHMSGDEFLVATCGLPGPKVEDLAARILRETRQRRVTVGGREEKFTVSIGITLIDPREENRVARDLAELAVKEAKRNGRNQYLWFTAELEKQSPRIDYRRDCPHCHTHFSFSVDEEIYRQAEAFFCPLCGKSITR